MCPLVIQQSVKHLLSANVDVHRLCKFLMEMSSAVSLFYHRHHILSVSALFKIATIVFLILFVSKWFETIKMEIITPLPIKALFSCVKL